MFAGPDGEPGPRRAWVGYERERLCRPHPDVSVVQETGSPTGIPRHVYETPVFKIREGVKKLHWDSWPRIDDAIASYKVFRRLRDERLIPAQMRFQIGLPFPSSALNGFKSNFAADYSVAGPAYEDLVNCGSVAAAREKGLYRMEGKEYVVKDGDVMLFKFNV